MLLHKQRVVIYCNIVIFRINESNSDPAAAPGARPFLLGFSPVRMEEGGSGRDWDDELDMGQKNELDIHHSLLHFAIPQVAFHSSHLTTHTPHPSVTVLSDVISFVQIIRILWYLALLYLLH